MACLRGSSRFAVFSLLMAVVSVWMYQLVIVRLEGFNPDQSRLVEYLEEGFCGMDGRNYARQEQFNDHPRTTTNNNINYNNIDGLKMMHRGPCGICSNLHDYQVYNETRLTLTRTATWCAVGYLLFGEGVARQCLLKSTGMSEMCVDCWVQNIQCTTAVCTPVCVKHFVNTYLEQLRIWLGLDEAGEYSSQFGKNNLSPCFKCDEMECGPGFKKCSGLNRRNAGFSTDIPRPDNEIFKN